MRRGPKPAHAIVLVDQERGELQHVARSWARVSHAEVVRAKIVLLAHDHPGWDNGTIARTVGCTARTVRTWRRRWKEVATLNDAFRPGAPRIFSLCPAGPDHRAGLYASG